MIDRARLLITLGYVAYEGRAGNPGRDIIYLSSKSQLIVVDVALRTHSPTHAVGLQHPPTPNMHTTRWFGVPCVLAGRSSHVRCYRAAHGEGGLVSLPEVEDASAAVALRELPAVRTGGCLLHTRGKPSFPGWLCIPLGGSWPF